MDSDPKDGHGTSWSPPVSEESGDSELWASDAAPMLSCAGEEVEEDDDDDDDDDDAESCNCCGDHGSAPRGYDSCDDDDHHDGVGGRGDEAVGGDGGAPVSWWAWLAQNEACGGEEVGRGEEEEVASVKPVAGMEDRLFWETCLAYGYP